MGAYDHCQYDIKKYGNAAECSDVISNLNFMLYYHWMFYRNRKEVPQYRVFSSLRLRILTR